MRKTQEREKKKIELKTKSEKKKKKKKKKEDGRGNEKSGRGRTGKYENRYLVWEERPKHADGRNNRRGTREDKNK